MNDRIITYKEETDKLDLQEIASFFISGNQRRQWFCYCILTGQLPNAITLTHSYPPKTKMLLSHK